MQHRSSRREYRLAPNRLDALLSSLPPPEAERFLVLVRLNTPLYNIVLSLVARIGQLLNRLQATEHLRRDILSLGQIQGYSDALNTYRKMRFVGFSEAEAVSHCVADLRQRLEHQTSKESCA